MLTAIHFFLTDFFYQQIQSKEEALVSGIRKGCPRPENLQVSFAALSHLPFFSGCKPAEALLITDSSLALHQLQKQGYYTIALYHSQNRSEDFSSTPYAVEDLFFLTYDSYEKAYQRLAGLPWEILRTPRLLLRESTLEDIDAFYEIYREPSITRYMENLFPEREAEYVYLKDYINKIYGFYGFGLWTVVDRSSGKMIGRAGLSVREGYELPELGFVTDVHFQHQGYTFEICDAILTYAREELLFPEIQAFVHPQNTSSIRLLERLGFCPAETVLLNKTPHIRYLYRTGSTARQETLEVPVDL